MTKNLRFYERRRNALMKKLNARLPLISGSMVQGFWECNIKGCRCKKGKPHSAWTLTWKEDKKTRTMYVPVDLREDVAKWNEEYRRIKGLIKKISEMSRIIIRGYVREKGLKAKKKK